MNTAQPLPRSLYIGIAILSLSACSNPDTTDPIEEKAKAGSPDAQIEWARKLYKDGDTEKSLQWYEKVLESEHNGSKRQAAMDLATGQFGKEKVAEGIDALEELGDVDSLVVLAKLQSNRNGELYNPTEAKKHYQKVADLGDARGLYQAALSQWNEQGYESYSSLDLQQLKNDLRRWGKDNEPAAFGLIGKILDLEGKVAEADSYFLQASEAGDPYSMYRTGIAYHRIANKHPYGKLGYDLLKKAETNGISETLTHLGLAYYKGYGVDPDIDKGISILQVAAWRGDEQAARYLTRAHIINNSWTFEINLDAGALQRRYPDIDERLGQRLSLKSHYSGKVFEKLVSKRNAQLQQIASAYEAGGIDNIATDNHSELWSELKEHGDQLIEAIKNPTAENTFAMAENYLSPSNSYANIEDALIWLELANQQRSSKTGMKLFELYENEDYRPLIPKSTLILNLQASSDRGDAEAALQLAREYFNGGIVPKNPKLTIRYGDIAYKAGIAEGHLLAKNAILSEEHPDFSDPVSAELINQLIEDGDEKLAYLKAKRLFVSHQNGDYTVRDLSGQTRSFKRSKDGISPNFWTLFFAMRWYKNTEDSDTPARFTKDPLTELKNTEGLPEPVVSSIETIRALAENGYPLARETVATWKLAGYFGDNDLDTAINWLKELSESDEFPTAILYLGLSKRFGYGQKIDVVGGALDIRRAAELGERKAREYFSDFQDQRNMSEFKYIESAYKAAKLEDPDAMLELANFFYNNQEFDEAYRNSEYSKWLGKSAAKDNIQALTQIGLSYYSGDGVDKNPRRGLRYLERCAALGDVTSLYHLGLFLILGGDIEADIPKGLQHIKNAAEKKDYKASILLNNIQRSYPNIPFEELDNEKLHTIAYNTLRDNDTFPTFPHLVRKGKLAPITGIKRGRPMFSLDGNTETGAKDEHPTFLAQKDFHKATIEITKIEYTTPFITTENGLIFTGNEGSVSFYAKPTEQIDNLFCVLAVRNGKRKADYDWEELGSLSPNKEKRIRFKIDISFKDPDEIALLFYSNGKEIVSNIRMQMNHFLDDNLSTFTKERIQYIIENSDTDVEPIMQNPISSYIFDYLHIAEGSKAYFDINEYGFVKAAHFSKEVEERTSNKILEILPYLTFYPRIKNGSPLPSKVAVPIE